MNIRRFARGAVALLLIAAPLALAQPPAGKPEPADAAAHPRSTGRVPQSVLDDFMSGFQGNSAAFERAMASTEQLIAQDPTNAEALAWRSSGLGMRAGRAFQSGEVRDGIRLWTESIEGMNRAVDMEPGNIQIRFVRGKSMLESALHDPNPATSGAAARTAIEDLELALGSFENLEKQLPKQTREEFHAWLYQASAKANDKERMEKYRALAGERADPAKDRLDRLAERSATGDSLRAAMAILDTETAAALREDLKAAPRDPARLDRALATLGARLEATPGDGAALAWRGFIQTLRAGPLFAQGKYEDGVKLWESATVELSKAISADPSLYEPLVLRALVRVEEARYDPEESSRLESARGAAQDIERARRLMNEAGVELSPDAGAELQIALAHAARAMNDTPRAKAAIEDALALKPSEAMTRRLQAAMERLNK